MREIKFRTWDTKRKEFMTMDYIYIEQDGDIIELDGETKRTMSAERFIICQYTGLKDKNGKEVYDGDLLQDGKGVGEVKWVQEHCAFLIRTLNPHMYHYLESDQRLTESEIIGNIYENSELAVTTS